MKKSTKKGVLINLDEATRTFLRSLAELNSSSQSQEVRRLLLNERNRLQTEANRLQQHGKPIRFNDSTEGSR